MSNLLKRILCKKALVKELTQKEIEEQHTASSNDFNITNESLRIARIENNFQK